jgi:hypothetical protein
LLCLTISEIVDYLNTIGFEVQKKEVNRLLFVLQKLKLVHREKRGHHIFFLPTAESRYLRYKTPESAGLLDRQTLQLDIARYYKATDRPRTRVIARKRGSTGADGDE